MKGRLKLDEKMHSRLLKRMVTKISDDIELNKK